MPIATTKDSIKRAKARPENTAFSKAARWDSAPYPQTCQAECAPHRLQRAISPLDRSSPMPVGFWPRAKRFIDGFLCSASADNRPNRVNPYYQSGDARAGRVQDLFGEIAPRYDLINDLQSFGLHRAWKRKLVELAAVRSGMTALDVCSGTGDIAFALSGRGAEVVGLDFSVPMLRVAAARKECAASFMQGDAQQLPFPDNMFDAVTVGYGLRNLASWRRGLEEMWRVAKPGGRLLVLEFGKPPNALWRALYFGYLRGAVPIFGRLFCNNAPAYAYIYESLQHYAGQNGVADYMRQLGCREARVINLIGGAMSINVGVK